MKIKTTANVAMALIVALATIDFDPSFARGGGRGGGGGMRGGGGASFSGGGGRGGGIRSGGPTSIGQSSASRGSFASNAAGGTRLADAGNRNTQISSNRGNNNRINTGDVNINNGNGWGGWVDHPVAAGVVTGAVVGATAAAVGSTYYDVPAGCPPYSSGGYTYYSCGGAYYQPQYEGDTVVYTTVPQP